MGQIKSLPKLNLSPLGFTWVALSFDLPSGLHCTKLQTTIIMKIKAGCHFMIVHGQTPDQQLTIMRKFNRSGVCLAWPPLNQ